jgi:hypothetical protein
MGERLLMFVDDMNMPRMDTYGTQQPIALLKMFVERKGFYDRGKELSWKNIKDVHVVAAMGPPGGARNAVDPRFISLFSAFEVQPPTNDNLRTIYQVGVGGKHLIVGCGHYHCQRPCWKHNCTAKCRCLFAGTQIVHTTESCLALAIRWLLAGHLEQASGEVEQLRHHPDGWRQLDRHHAGAVQCSA